MTKKDRPSEDTTMVQVHLEYQTSLQWVSAAWCWSSAFLAISILLDDSKLQTVT